MKNQLLWDKYYNQIKKVLSYMMQRNGINEDARVIEAYAMQLSDKWNPEKAHEKWFPMFVVQRGIWAYIDSIRDRSTPHISLHSINPNSIVYDDKQMDRVDWQDTKDAITNHLIQFKDSKYYSVIQTIITERILPMCSGEPFMCIDGIAAKHSIAPQTVSRIINEDVKEYLEQFI